MVDRERARRQLAARTGVAAATSAGAVALDAITGHPIGSALVPVILPTAEDVLSRVLSTRQRHRINDLIGHAAASYCELYDQGARLRDDDFFKDRDGRWSSQEVVEAALMAASNEPQELKLPYLGHLLAALAVTPEVDVSSAHWVLAQAHALTWIQYVQLAIIAAADTHEISDVDIRPIGRTWEEFNATAQLADLGLGGRAIIGAPAAKTPRMGITVPNMKLSEQRLLNPGHLLHGLLGLEAVPKDTQQEQLAVLVHALTRGEPELNEQERPSQ